MTSTLKWTCTASGHWFQVPVVLLETPKGFKESLPITRGQPNDKRSEARG